MKKVNLLSKAEMRKVMGGVADSCGTGYVPYTCNTSIYDATTGQTTTSSLSGTLNCVPAANGGSSSNAAEWVNDRMLSHNQCVGTLTCDTSCNATTTIVD